MYIGVCCERMNNSKIAPCIVLTTPNKTPENFPISNLQRTMTTTAILNFSKRKQAKKVSKHWILYPSSPKVSLYLLTEKEGVRKWSIESLASSLKKRSMFPGLKIRTALPCVKMVHVGIFRTVSEAKNWIILSCNFFIFMGIHIQARLVSTVGNYVLYPMSAGWNSKGFLEGIGSGKFHTRDCLSRDQVETQ